jgi:hypothetical protein
VFRAALRQTPNTIAELRAWQFNGPHLKILPDALLLVASAARLCTGTGDSLTIQRKHCS